MKIAVRYQSRGGNTKAVAEEIAKAAGVTAETIDIPLTDKVDILFIGGGMYAWDIDEKLKLYLQNLSPELVNSVAAFSTGGGMSGTNKIADIVKGKDIAVHSEGLPLKFGIRNHQLLMGKKGYIELTDKQINAINEFVKKVIK